MSKSPGSEFRMKRFHLQLFTLRFVRNNKITICRVHIEVSLRRSIYIPSTTSLSSTRVFKIAILRARIAPFRNQENGNAGAEFF